MHALIICNGEPPGRHLFQHELTQADILIAADGGTYTFLDYDVVPDITIGDMDSYHSDQHNFPVISLRDQETNDLEKALQFACKKGVKSCVILGATGRRLDHTLKNISVLQQFNSHYESLLIKDNYGDTSVLDHHTKLHLPINTTISLFPISGTVTNIVLKGFEYSLENECLTNGKRDGTSNKIVKTPAEISYEQGTLVMFVYQKGRKIVGGDA